MDFIPFVLLKFTDSSDESDGRSGPPGRRGSGGQVAVFVLLLLVQEAVELKAFLYPDSRWPLLFQVSALCVLSDMSPIELSELSLASAP